MELDVYRIILNRGSLLITPVLEDVANNFTKKLQASTLGPTIEISDHMVEMVSITNYRLISWFGSI